MAWWRRRKRLDAGHREIVKALRAQGCTVVSLSTLGGGAPDLLVGYRRLTILIEVKRPDLRDHAPDNLAEKLRLEAQAEWRAKWAGGPVVVVYDVAGALAALEPLGATVGAPFSPEAVAARRTRRRRNTPSQESGHGADFPS